MMYGLSGGQVGTRCVRRIVYATLVACCLLGANPPADADTDFPRIFPHNCAVYLEWTSWDELIATSGPHAEFLQEQAGKFGLFDVLAQLFNNAQQAGLFEKVESQEFIQQCQRFRFCLAIYPPDGASGFTAALVIDCGEQRLDHDFAFKGFQSLTILAEKLNLPASDAEREAPGDGTIAFNDRLFAGRHGGRLCIATSHNLLAAILARCGQTESELQRLSDNRRFQTVFTQCGKAAPEMHRVARMFVDPERLLSIWNDDTRQLKEYLTTTGMDAVIGMGAELAVGSGEPQMDFVVNGFVMLTETSTVFSDILLLRNRPVTVPDFIPEVSQVYASLDLEVQSLAQRVAILYERFFGEESFRRQVLDDFEQRNGFGLEQALEILDGGFRAFISPRGGKDSAAAITYAAKLNDVPAAVAILDKHFETINSRRSPPIQRIERAGRYMWLERETHPDEPSANSRSNVAIIDEYLVFSSDTPTLIKMVDGLDQQKKSQLARAADVQAMRQYLERISSDTACMVIIFDPWPFVSALFVDENLSDEHRVILDLVRENWSRLRDSGDAERNREPTVSVTTTMSGRFGLIARKAGGGFQWLLLKPTIQRPD